MTASLPDAGFKAMSTEGGPPRVLAGADPDTATRSWATNTEDFSPCWVSPIGATKSLP